MTMIQITEVPIDNLFPNPWNTNVVSPENEQKIEASLKRFGMFRPLLARKRRAGLPGFEILGGQHRWGVAKRLGHETVPVIVLDNIDDKKAKEIGLVDNGRYGEDDTLQLAELLKELGDVDSLLEFLPYDGADLAGIFASSDIDLFSLDVPEDSDIPEISLTPKAQTHQIMRFKVPIEDADAVQKAIEMTMKTQNFTEDDSMTNAGNALVHLLRAMK